MENGTRRNRASRNEIRIRIVNQLRKSTESNLNNTKKRDSACRRESDPEFATISRARARYPGFASRYPGFASRRPGFAPRDPGFAPRHPGFAPRAVRSMSLLRSSRANDPSRAAAAMRLKTGARAPVPGDHRHGGSRVAATLIQDVLRVVSHARVIEDGNVFLLETRLAMMFLLPCDISGNGLDRGRAYADGAISVLPREFRGALA